MLLLRYTSLLFCIIIFNVLPQSRYNYEISGNNVFEKTVIEKYLSTFPPQETNSLADSINIRLRLLYQNNGYFNSNISIRIDSISNPKIVSLSISEHNPTKVSDIILNFSDTLSNSAVISLIGELYNTVYSSANLNDGIKRCLNYCQDNGYPFCEIKLLGICVNSGNDSLTINMKIDKKSFVKITGIETTEKISTNKDVLMRELGFLGTRVYNQKWVSSIPIKLMKLKLFENVGEPVYYPLSRTEGIIKLPIKERNNNTFDGIIGYVPSSNKTEPSYISGFIDIAFQNLLGTARAAKFHWQKLNKNSSVLEFSYTEPWIFSYPVSGTVSVFQNKQDSTFISYGGSLSFEYLFSDGLYFSINGGMSSVVPSLLNAVSNLVPNSSKVTGGVGLKYDNRDDPFAPTAGYISNNQILYDSKTVSSSPGGLSNSKTTIKQQKVLLDFNIYKSVVANAVIYLGLSAKYLSGESKDISDVFRIGGAKSLRGYIENQFYTDKAILSKLEFRGIFEKRSHAFLFVDGGLLNKWNSAFSNESSPTYFRAGYGLGLSFSTNLGNLSVSFALGKGDDFSTGKIHFGIQNEF